MGTDMGKDRVKYTHGLPTGMSNTIDIKNSVVYHYAALLILLMAYPWAFFKVQSLIDTSNTA